MIAPPAHSTALLGLASCLFSAACDAPPPVYPAVVMAPVPVPAPVTPPPANRPKVAVLPLEDDKLFRLERAALRADLIGSLARLATDHTVLPLAEVDVKLRPVSRATGHRCIFEGESAARRARAEGWLTTDVIRVGGLAKGPGEALWVELLEGEHHTVATFEAPLNSKLLRFDQYRAAFAALVRTDGGGLIGGLGATGSEAGALREGPITICESKYFGACEPGSVDWKDHASDMLACFSGEDDVSRDMLVQGEAGASWCEAENLDIVEGREGAREACLCRALLGSAAMGKRPGRRTVRVHYEAPDLAGKPRPEIRVIEATTNLHTEDDWHSMRDVVDGKERYQSVRRLVVDNLDGLAAPLARCAVPAGGVVVADIDVREDGAPTGGKILSGLAEREAAACLEQALTRGAFACTSDGKPARIRIAMQARGR